MSNGKIITGYYDNTIKIWNTDQKNFTLNKCEFYLVGHTSPVLCFSELSDGKIVSGTLKIWNIQTQQCELTLRSDNVCPINICCVLSDGYRVVSSSDRDLKILNTQTDQQNKYESFSTSHYMQIRCCVVLKNNRIITGSYDHTLKIWNIETKKRELTLKGHYEVVWCCSILSDSNNNTGLVSVSSDTTLKIWNIRTDAKLYNCELTLCGHRNIVSCCSVLPDGNIVSGSDDTVKVWNGQSGACLLTWNIPGHSMIIYSNVLSDGRLLIANIFWNISNMELIRTCKNPTI